MFFIRRHLIEPLNQAVKTAAGKFNWQLVGGLSQDFITHGYVARDRWFRTNTDAVARQGHNEIVFGVFKTSSGAVHPNELGHRNISRHLLDVMGPRVRQLVAQSTCRQLTPPGTQVQPGELKDEQPDADADPVD